MPIEPPDPLRLAETLRAQLSPLADLLAAHADRPELAAALNGVAGAVVLLERVAKLTGPASKG